MELQRRLAEKGADRRPDSMGEAQMPILRPYAMDGVAASHQFQGSCDGRTLVLEVQATLPGAHLAVQRDDTLPASSSAPFRISFSILETGPEMQGADLGQMSEI